jgi:molecular chaperone GrpE
VESPEHEPGMVVEELQAGYRYLDRVIRPSMVKVSK